MAVIAALWWSYFDWVIIIAQARLAGATGPERAVLARDLYSTSTCPWSRGSSCSHSV